MAAAGAAGGRRDAVVGAGVTSLTLSVPFAFLPTLSFLSLPLLPPPLPGPVLQLASPGHVAVQHDFPNLSRQGARSRLSFRRVSF